MKIETAEDLERIVDTQQAALDIFSQALLKLVDEQKATAGKINELIADRDQQVKLIGGLLQRIEVLVKLVDSDHASILVLLARAGEVNPRDVN